MPQSSKEEILVKYAELINPPLIKLAWSWKDIVQSLLPDVLTTGAVAAVAGPAAAVAIGTTPVGWIIGGALIAGGISYAIYEATQITDDNLKDLIARLDALDPNENAKEKVELWIKRLTDDKQIFTLPPTTTSPEAKALYQGNQIMQMGKLVEYLKEIKAEWPEVKKNLTDVAFDPGEAEKAINLTVETIQKQYIDLVKKVRDATAQHLQDLSKKSGQNYTTTATEIENLYNELTQLGGKAPIFDSAAEASGWELAQRILGKSEDATPLTEEELKQGFQVLTNLKTLLEQGKQHYANFSVSPAAPVKASVNKRPLSKRALTLGDGTKIGPQQSNGGKRGRPQQITNKEVASIQRSVNHLSAIYAPEATILNEDGFYGPQTAKSLSYLLGKMEGLNRDVARYVMVSPAYVLDYKRMSQDSERLSALNKLLTHYSQKEVGYVGEEQTEAEPQKERQLSGRSVKCPLNKGDDITDEEINACLMDMDIEDEKSSPRPMRAVDWLTLQGYTTPEQRAKIVRELGSKVSGLPDAEQWMQWPNYIKDIVRKRQNYQQWGPGQFGVSR